MTQQQKIQNVLLMSIKDNMDLLHFLILLLQSVLTWFPTIVCKAHNRIQQFDSKTYSTLIKHSTLLESILELLSGVMTCLS
jgi:glucose-6-phosphate-specific signal transduction histidine kinase